jgi:BA14K-like protein
MKLKFALLFVLTAALPAPAQAAKIDYCKAFAQDFADARSIDETSFQHKYNISYRACMNESKDPLKRSVKKIVVLKNAASNGPLNLAPGSTDWNIYCANKYTSFDPAKGTYKSFTGVERKCVLSPN